MAYAFQWRVPSNAYAFQWRMHLSSVYLPVAYAFQWRMPPSGVYLPVAYASQWRMPPIGVCLPGVCPQMVWMFIVEVRTAVNLRYNQAWGSVLEPAETSLTLLE
jgi:hypothetical protein